MASSWYMCMIEIRIQVPSKQLSELTAHIDSTCTLNLSYLGTYFVPISSALESPSKLFAPTCAPSRVQIRDRHSPNHRSRHTFSFHFPPLTESLSPLTFAAPNLYLAYTSDPPITHRRSGVQPLEVLDLQSTFKMFLPANRNVPETLKC